MAARKRRGKADTVLKGLQPNEAIAVQAIANGDPVNASLVEAGVRARDASSGLSVKLRRAVDALHAERLETFHVEAEDLLKHLAGIVYDPETSHRDQIQAARLMADCMGMTKRVSVGIRLSMDAARAATEGMGTLDMIASLATPAAQESD